LILLYLCSGLIDLLYFGEVVSGAKLVRLRNFAWKAASVLNLVQVGIIFAPDRRKSCAFRHDAAARCARATIVTMQLKRICPHKN
jgi:hypothetical protein